MQIQFPSSFLWGAALSSYQCEGENFNCDWYLWEKEKGLKAAGSACNHYRLFEKDFKLASSFNLNSLRISLEWSRIHLDASCFSQQELAHYREVVDTLIKHKLKPIVTLHHFTNPLWFVKKGGWSEAKNVDYFLNFLIKAVETLKEKVEFWVIFNEPLVYIYNSFIQGIWPPGEKSFKQAKRVLNNIIAAYLTGYQELKRIYQGSALSAQVSIAKSLRVFFPCPGLNLWLNSLSASLRSRYFNFWLLDYLTKRNALDFLGINYYCREFSQFKGLFGRESDYKPKKGRRNYLGWNIYPQGFYRLLKKIARYNLPIIITENGTAEYENSLYEDFLIGHLRNLAAAINEGVDIRGYLWWSLIDNFEWDKGFGPCFGLAEVDHKTFKRSPKPFSATYSKIIKENRLEI
ncbi:MAG: family 1 glycosylhydrolase [Candidatus Omnitrophota bacterium]